MSETSKEAQKRRLAEALRANLRRRKAAGRGDKADAPTQEAAEPSQQAAADGGQRG